MEVSKWVEWICKWKLQQIQLWQGGRSLMNVMLFYFIFFYQRYFPQRLQYFLTDFAGYIIYLFMLEKTTTRKKINQKLESHSWWTATEFRPHQKSEQCDRFTECAENQKLSEPFAGKGAIERYGQTQQEWQQYVYPYYYYYYYLFCSVVQMLQHHSCMSLGKWTRTVSVSSVRATVSW